jgi:TP901 family phage tail tape measure protein
MANFVVSTAFAAGDKGIISFFRQLRMQALSFGKDSKKGFRQASKSALSFKKIVGGIVTAGALTKGINLATQGVRGLTEEFVTFDHALTAASAKFPEKIKRGTKEFAELGQAARKVGAETQFTATQAAEGLNFLAMAGFDAKKSIAALPGVVDLATAADMDLARATDIASDALGAFGLMTDDTDQLVTNLARINDVFAKTVTSSNTDLEQLFETMKESGPAIKGAGGDVETFGALLGTMANAGIKGSKAGTTLKNMYLRLASPPAEAAAQLRKLNIVTRDSSGNLIDMANILGQISYATKDMGTATKTAAMDAIFSKRAVNGATVAMDIGVKALKDYRKGLEESSGASRDMASEMRKSLQNRFAEIKSAAIEVGLKFADVFKKKIPGFMDTVVKSIRRIDVSAIIEDMKTFGKFLKGVWEVVKALSPIIWGVVAALAAYKVVLLAVAAVQIVQAIVAFTVALKGAAVAQGILNAVMLANPILALVALIGLLVAAGVALYQNWDTIAAKLAETWEDIMKTFEEFIAPILEFFGIGDAKTFKILAADTRGQIDLFGGAEKARIKREERGRREFTAAKPGFFDSNFEAPNKEIEAARRERLDVNAKMTFVNPPEGSTFESDFFGAPKIEKEALGAN